MPYLFPSRQCLPLPTSTDGHPSLHHVLHCGFRQDMAKKALVWIQFQATGCAGSQLHQQSLTRLQQMSWWCSSNCHMNQLGDFCNFLLHLILHLFDLIVKHRASHNLMILYDDLWPAQLGNSTCKPMGITPATHTWPMEYLYLQTHRFTHQNRPKLLKLAKNWGSYGWFQWILWNQL